MSELTLRAAMQAYIDDLRRRRLNHDYIASAQLVLWNFAHGQEAREVRTITHEDVHAHLAARETDLAPSTLKSYRQKHRAFWRFCAWREWTAEDIFRKPAPVPYAFVDGPLDFEVPSTVAEAMALYVEELDTNGASKPHIKTVRSRLKQFAVLAGARPLTEVKARDLQNHFRELGKKLSEASLAGLCSTQKAFWNFCCKQGWLTDSPAAKLKRYSYKSAGTKAVPEDHVQAVIDALDDFIAYRDEEPRDVRDALFVSLSIDSGARRGEITNLRRSRVEKALDNGMRLAKTKAGMKVQSSADDLVIYTVASSGKTGPTTLRFTSNTAALFRKWFKLVDKLFDPAISEDRVFLSIWSGQPIRADSIGNSSFRRICTFAGVPIFRSHAVRHRNITEIIDLTGDPKVAQLVAGHASLEITLEVYNQTLEKHAVDATAQLAARRRDKVQEEAAIEVSPGYAVKQLVELLQEEREETQRLRVENEQLQAEIRKVLEHLGGLAKVASNGNVVGSTGARKE